MESPYYNTRKNFMVEIINYDYRSYGISLVYYLEVGLYPLTELNWLQITSRCDAGQMDN